MPLGVLGIAHLTVKLVLVASGTETCSGGEDASIKQLC